MRFLLAASLLTLSIGLAATTPQAKEEKPNVRYRKAKDIDFEALLVQGQLKRPEMSVVTGDVRDATDGLLRLREDFLDRMAQEGGEAP